MDQVVVVHVLGVEQVTVLLLAEVLWVNPVGPEEFLVCNAERLPYGLCNQLGLEQQPEGKTVFSGRAAGGCLVSLPSPLELSAVWGPCNVR